MRFIYGFIFAVVVLTCGAAIHDNSAGADRQLVNWSNLADFVRDTSTGIYTGIKDQIDRWTKQP